MTKKHIKITPLPSYPIPTGAGARETPDPEIYNRDRLAQIKSYGRLRKGWMDLDGLRELPGKGRLTLELKAAADMADVDVKKAIGEVISYAHLAIDTMNRGGVGIHIEAVHNSKPTDDVDVAACLVSRIFMACPLGWRPNFPGIINPATYTPAQRAGIVGILLRDENGGPYTVKQVEDAIEALLEKHPPKRWRDFPIILAESAVRAGAEFARRWGWTA